MGVLAQMRIRVGVGGDPRQQQRRQFRGARAAGGHVPGQVGKGAGDQVCGGLRGHGLGSIHQT